MRLIAQNRIPIPSLVSKVMRTAPTPAVPTEPPRRGEARERTGTGSSTHTARAVHDKALTGCLCGARVGGVDVALGDQRQRARPHVARELDCGLLL